MYCYFQRSRLGNESEAVLYYCVCNRCPPVQIIMFTTKAKIEKRESDQLNGLWDSRWNIIYYIFSGIAKADTCIR